MGPSSIIGRQHWIVPILLLSLLPGLVLSQSTSPPSPLTSRYGHTPALFHAAGFNVIIGGIQPDMTPSAPTVFPLVKATGTDDGSLSLSPPNITDYYVSFPPSSTASSNTPWIIGAASMTREERTLVYGGIHLPDRSSHGISYLTTSGWQTVNATGALSRSEHSLSPLPSPSTSAFLVGGCDGEAVDCVNASRIHQDLSQVDFYSGDTTSLTSPPHGWYQHTASIVPSGELVILGGVRTGGYLESFGIIQVYNISQGTWGDRMISGAIPTPRRDHAAVVYRDSIVVTGGASLDLSTRYSDTLLLNTTTWTWETLTFNQTLAGRRGHSAQMISPTVMLLSFGDFGSNDPGGAGSWVAIDLDSRTVLPRIDNVFIAQVTERRHKKRLGPGDIALIVVFSVVGLVAIALITWWWARREVRPDVGYSSSSRDQRPYTPDSPPSRDGGVGEWTVIRGRAPTTTLPRRFWLALSSPFRSQGLEQPEMEDRVTKGVFNPRSQQTSAYITRPYRPQEPPSPVSSSSTAISRAGDRAPLPSEHEGEWFSVNGQTDPSKRGSHQSGDSVPFDQIEGTYEDLLRSRAFHSYLSLSDPQPGQVYQERQEDRV
ncbi:hypothetical protein BJ684DRAFT_17315 [Piptocephalis cylindrospora]|uniref:Galactose oxidase n=1 Tax=Piptocephalis cylindrospora TaxID=1907219 RepID=A0A4P9Y0Z6_9FUNG|nr:hypothetical protein BJ684DRAFT_17315 [Piptocephalis cylindrospora]|eukprot:RKP12172.1 hypothetical protein BJ684DRAFT_17315 [Piptocephalis cylindrospora]